MLNLLQYVFPSLVILLGILFAGRKWGMKNAEKVQDKAEEEIKKAGEETAKAKAETVKAQTEAKINSETAKIVSAQDQTDNAALKEKADQGTIDIDSLVSQVVESSRKFAQEAQKRYEK